MTTYVHACMHKYIIHTRARAHTHTRTYIYIYIYMRETEIKRKTKTKEIESGEERRISNEGKKFATIEKWKERRNQEKEKEEKE